MNNLTFHLTQIRQITFYLVIAKSVLRLVFLDVPRNNLSSLYYLKFLVYCTILIAEIYTHAKNDMLYTYTIYIAIKQMQFNLKSHFSPDCLLLNVNVLYARLRNNFHFQLILTSRLNKCK